MLIKRDNHMLARLLNSSVGNILGEFTGVVTMIFVFFFSSIAMNPVPMTCLWENLPFTLRAKGLTIFDLAQLQE
jgi:hypothetical protein